MSEDTPTGKACDAKLIKIPSTGGKSFTQIQRDTDKVIREKTEKFTQILSQEVREIRKLFHIYNKNADHEVLKDIFHRVHNLRGQGTLFNYPLVTSIGGHFCAYINSLQEGERPRKEAVQCFLLSITMVQSNNIKGEGSGQIVELLSLMKEMVDKLIKE